MYRIITKSNKVAAEKFATYAEAQAAIQRLNGREIYFVA